MAAVLVGLALVVVFLWGLPWLMLGGVVSAQLPDPAIRDGDPCCGHPDTWAQVAGGLGHAAVLSVVEALILSAGVGLLGWSFNGRREVGRRFVGWAVGGTLGGLIAVSAFSFVSSARAHRPTDCDAFVFRAADWRSTDEDVHRRTAYGVAECGLMAKKTPKQVVAMLGEPYEKETIGRPPYEADASGRLRFASIRWHYDYLSVELDGTRRALWASAGARDEAGG